MSDLFSPPPPPPTPAPQRRPYLDGLNPVQREAVEALDGPVLVLAGAGTGKTRVLTTRLAHLLLSRRVSPWNVLTVTFTNKAAREMRERVDNLLGSQSEGWWMGTFHSLAARILRRHAELIGLKPSFTILDTDDQIRLLKQLMEAENVDAKKWPARMLLSIIERWKDRALTPDKLKPEEAGDAANGRILTLYRQYQDRLKALNACDFGDLLLHNITLFQQHNDVLIEYQNRFRYILVDEYQDTNVAQYLWLRLLAQSHRNICCVGDDDQSIYGWRGAEVGNILRFEHDFPGATIIRLEQNYRSTAHILGAAHGIIAHNQGRLGKQLWTETDGGEKVKVRGLWDAEEEARWVGEEVEALQRKGASLGQMAVLVRAGFQTREFEERFITLGLPYRVVGGPRFYERQEIRDALAYLRVLVSPEDDLAFERIVNVPKRGVGAATIQQLYVAARTLGVPVTEAAWKLSQTDELKPKMRTTLSGLMQDFFRWRGLIDRIPHTELAQMVLDESGYTRMWQEDKTPEAPGRLENLKELINAMGEFENLTGFLEHVSLVMENAAGADVEQISLMTLHGAKGLEFDVVFLPGWEEGVFPSQRTLDENGIAGLEEERRLAYVGITRGRQRVYISHAANRRIHGTWATSIPSRFVEELPEEHIETENNPGIGGAGFGGGRGEGGYGGGYGGGWGGGGGGFGDRFNRMGQKAAQAPARGGRLIEGTALDVTPRSRPNRAYNPGDRVFHSKFGYGTVKMVENDKLEISFDVAGIKKVMDSFVVPADKAG
ncbi:MULTISPECIES: ATP-dependent helicase [unclassified Azospirillum]|uniref:ATP-dependent helicase n=1 Tax=unclassified Azospirillum TaxID=2630922 RepID=UPI000B7184AB|nr:MULTISPECIES: UvrD-helicase domain-containing protein [unclassified Azospirillum]SNR86592.1 DNA helicase-2 / ATP-dependent DNA helicase PcrA [Azospirillum sp. RU38E]SNS02727.1 DNA helicase-2 / ATP-dependent DNA helicase PcrA [Azospirillum sp. RU37A]